MRYSISILFLFVMSATISTGIFTEAYVISAIEIPDGPSVEKITYEVITQDDQQILALQNDDIDIIGDMVDPVFLDSLTETANIDVASVLRNGYGSLVINTAKYPLNITDFRRAFSFAFDKETISDDVWGGLSVPQDSIIPQVSPYSIEGMLPYTYYEANVVLGNQLLDEAGFADIDEDGFREAPDGSDFDVLIEYAQSSNIAVEVGAKAQDALIALGIDGISTAADYNEYLTRLNFHGDFDIAFIGRSFTNFDADWIAYEYASSYADEPYYNYPNFRNATYDSWRDQLLHGTSYELVLEAALAMQEILVFQCPEVVCYENILLTAYRTDRFEGHVNDVMDGVPSWWTNYKVHLKDAYGGPLGGTFRWSNPLDMDTFNFMATGSAYTMNVLDMLYDSLLRRDQDGNDLMWIAESYVIEDHEDNPSVPDGHTRFTFDLIQNVLWSDKTPLTAEDVAFSLNYYRDAPGNPYGEDLGELVAAYAVTPYNLVVEFDAVSFWYLHTIGYKPIIPKHVFEEIGIDNWATWNPDPTTEPMVTSGPFVVSKYTAGESTELTKNPLYFGSSENDPFISPAEDVIYEVGTTGNKITWSVFSANPNSYWIYRDDTLVTTGDWIDDTIEISVDGLPVGIYEYELVVENEAEDRDTDSVYVIVNPLLTGDIIFDYSHGQYNAYIEQIDNSLFSNLTALGYDCIPATGGINSTILQNANGFVAGSINGDLNGYTADEITDITNWFNSGEKFMWIGYDSDYAGMQYINDNMTAILNGVGSHVYGEPLSVEDAISNAGAGYRPVANVTGTDPFVLPAVAGVEKVLMHGPTCLYGSISGEYGIGAVPLELTNITNVYPLLKYGAAATIVNSDLIDGYAHAEGAIGSFVAATLEINAGNAGSGIIVTSGASPYGDYRPMCTEEYYDVDLTGMRFVVQTIIYGMLLSNLEDLMPPTVNSPEDISFIVGELGHSIDWIGQSNNPASYRVYLNDSLYTSGTWNSSEEFFNISLDGFAIGGYEFTIVLTTTMGFSVNDSVLVKVSDQEEIPDILLPNLSIIITIGSVGFILVIVILIYKSRSTGQVVADWSYA